MNDSQIYSKRQNRSREDSKTERADPKQKTRSSEGSGFFVWLTKCLICIVSTSRDSDSSCNSSLLLQISILKDKLQNSTDREVKLNEKIAKMSESDKIEQENKRLKERNESLKREKMYAKQEAETRVSNFKAQYDADYREVKKQKERLANEKKNWMRKKPTSRKVYLIKLDTFVIS